MTIFKAYDIRGIYPTELNEGLAFKIGVAFGMMIQGRIVVNSDFRLSSPSLKKELIRGIISSGCDVIDIGQTSTPMNIFSTKFLQADAGISVTASHNSKEYNGFKFYDKNAVPISHEAGIKNIEEMIKKGEFKRGAGTIIRRDIEEDYIKFLLDKIRISHNKMKVVIDCGNGATSLIYPKIMKRLDTEFVELCTEPNGNFPNHEPDPSNKENLKDLQKKVLETNADIGFACDGDGDRLAVIDGKGNVIESTKVFQLLIENLLKENPKSKIIYDVLASGVINDDIKNYGGIPIVCRVGHTYIGRKMVEENAALAGELSGHYFFKEIHGADDAVFASLKIIYYLTKLNKKISEIIKEYPSYYSENLRIPINDKIKFAFIDNLRDEFNKKNYKVDTLDGVKVFIKDSWVLFRPSNTEPKISIAYEAKDKESFEEIKSFAQDIISKIPS